ncbi:UPF0173 metal-dependent hydrolase [Enterococcus florum]|uniref:UPF0173 metal-dependent hydrolase NRIC_08630 n=1 Tax=Enterococcus florum TaxID=2480627 RepID=A0A4P5PC07_9ENTE|nr:metal-dependent hydrolase [Enterococcus florum]GCF92972.1 UPF0173 metal-dependent hydrolase [Enterococcus florum]
MKLSYHGHSVLFIEMDNGEKILVDPFITGNPLTDLHVAEVKTDWLLITHGHEDHVGDMVPIAKQNNATVVGIVELCTFAEKEGVKQTHGMNIGGSHTFSFGKLKMIHAQHSTGYQKDGEMIYLGEPAGFLLQAEGKTIYHAGDTALFGDMALLGRKFEIDIAFLPIGDNFTMGPEDAVEAAKMLNTKKVVPIHYNTFPLIKQDPQQLVRALPEGVVEIMEVGQVIEL